MTNADMIEYKDYHGSVHFDADERIFHGKIEFIRDLVSYEARDADSLIKEFQNAVDSYLNLCTSANKQPDKPFKGTFNVRIGSVLHKELHMYALRHDQNLNHVIKSSLDQLLLHEHKYEQDRRL